MSARLQSFVAELRSAVASAADEAQLLVRVKAAMGALVAQDDWLPAECAQPDPSHYRQYLLYQDAQERFCVVSFVWGPGQATPVHDHTVWGVIGMLRGAELGQRFVRHAQGGLRESGPPHRLDPGAVEAVSPRIGDIHRVSNAFADRVSISIHAYGADIGRVARHVFDPSTGAARTFVSGYSNERAWLA